jgi:hypothetical protein
MIHIFAVTLRQVHQADYMVLDMCNKQKLLQTFCGKTCHLQGKDGDGLII